MKKSLTLAMTVLVLSAQGTPGHSEAKAELELEACLVGVSDLGRMARFSGTALYRLESDDKGEIREVVPLERPPETALITIDDFEACLRRWRLEPSRSYTVQLRFGTAGELLQHWQILVLGPDGAITLTLPRRQGADGAG